MGSWCPALELDALIVWLLVGPNENTEHMKVGFKDHPRFGFALFLCVIGSLINNNVECQLGRHVSGD